MPICIAIGIFLMINTTNVTEGSSAVVCVETSIAPQINVTVLLNTSSGSASGKLQVTII